MKSPLSFSNLYDPAKVRPINPRPSRFDNPQRDFPHKAMMALFYGAFVDDFGNQIEVDYIYISDSATRHVLDNE